MMSPAELRLEMTGGEWFTASPGGASRYFTELYLALHARLELNVTAAAFGEAVPGARSWGPTRSSLLWRVGTSFFDSAALPRGGILDRHFCLYGRPAIDGRGVHPLVVHFHGPWYQESRVAGAGELEVLLKYWFERLRYARADKFVVLSDHFRELMTTKYRVSEDRIEVIPPGVDLKRFDYRERNFTSRTVLCVRRLERRMGIDVLIDAWRGVKADHVDANLVIVGTGTQDSALRAKAAEAGLAQSISFVGRASDDQLRELYHGAAVTVVPSIALEGFGMIALESLAVGRAPIVTDCGGLPDSVLSLDKSLVVPRGNAEALAARIVAALDGDIPGPQRCREHAETFSWDIAAKRHIALYRNLA